MEDHAHTHTDGDPVPTAAMSAVQCNVECTVYGVGQWRRQGERGKFPPYGWTSKNNVICVCFHGHGTSSYHTTNTLQGRRATLIQRQYNRDWGTSYSRPTIDPYLTSPLLQNPDGASGVGQCAGE